MNKLLAVPVVIGAGYVGLKIFETALSRTSVSLSFDPKSPKNNPLTYVIVRRLIKNLHYTAFCEITGCTVEFHANNQVAFHDMMRTHLDKDH